MPFTLSHPALVLPFFSRVKTPGWRASLVFGSMAPDFWVLGPGLLERASTHGRWGLLICPPIALVFTWCFHRWLQPRIQRLPGIPPGPSSGRIEWGWAALGAFLGSATHVLWDQLTHEGSRLQSHHPVFDKVLFVVGNDAITVGQAAWIGSSALGLAILGAWMLRALRQSGSSLRAFLDRRWLVIGLSALLPGLTYFSWRLFPVYSGTGPLRFVVDQVADMRYLVVVSGLTTATAAWLGSVMTKNASREGRR